MKYYRKHNCARNHRSYRTAAKCIWPKAHSIEREGSFACLAWCGSGPWSTALTITLWESQEEAQKAKDWIDRHACGGQCTKKRRA